MLERLKSLGAGVLGLIAILGIFVLCGVLLGGMSWLSEHLLPWFLLASAFVFACEIIVFLPLSMFRKTRSFAAMAFLYASFFFGVTVWMDGLLTTETLWGTWAVILGLCFAGIGVVPLGMVAALFHGRWVRLTELVFLVAVMFGSRFYAFWQAAKADRVEEEHYRAEA